MCSLAAALWLANDRHFYHFNVSAQLWIVEGTPLLPGQHSLRVSYFLGTPAPAVTEADAVAEDPGISLQFMADLIVTPETTTAELKRMIVEQFPTVRIPSDAGSDSVEVTLSVHHLRLREVLQHKTNPTTNVLKLGKVSDLFD